MKAQLVYRMDFFPVRQKTSVLRTYKLKTIVSKNGKRLRFISVAKYMVRRFFLEKLRYAGKIITYVDAGSYTQRYIKQ
jgi:hypothetical protein